MTGENRWRGEYDLQETYVLGDIVSFIDTNKNYICVIDQTSGIPPYFYDSGFEPFIDSGISPTDITVIYGGDF